MLEVLLLQDINVLEEIEMGLDILLFDKDNKIIGQKEITLSLHEEIFNGKTKCNWSNFPYLKKLKDYYKTNIIFTDNEIKAFLDDLMGIKSFLDEGYESKLSSLIKDLDNKSVYKIHIAGD